jgi:hypothetical protein
MLFPQTGPDLPTGIIATIDRFTDFLVGYLSALAAVGALAMAAIEFGKKLFDWRTRFHARRVLGFIEATTAEREEKARRLGVSEGSPPDAVLAELIQLGTGVSEKESSAKARSLVANKGGIPLWHAGKRDPAHAVFALELEKMMGAIQEAGDVALTTPSEHRHLYLLMTSGANDRDVEDWYANGERVMTAAADTSSATSGAAPGRADVKKLGDQFTRLRQIMKRRLDAFQLYTNESWASWNQLWANVVGAITMFIVLMWMRQSADPNAPGYGAVVILSVLGGVLSPVAKDLLNLLKRVKSG